jgi:uncharacterized membrane protein
VNLDRFQIISLIVTVVAFIGAFIATVIENDVLWYVCMAALAINFFVCVYRGINSSKPKG